MQQETQSKKVNSKIRLGLCCLFFEEEIQFQNIKIALFKKYKREEQLKTIAEIIRHNGQTLFEAIKYCQKNEIGAFRISSDIWPIKTHQQFKYKIEDLENSQELINLFKKAGNYAKECNVRLLFHPDQFVILSSPNQKVLDHSIEELEYHGEIAEIVNADVINIHCGRAYGDKKTSLKRIKKVFSKLSDKVKQRLTLENDDKTFTPEDLIPLCEELGIPFCYDIHHHRCAKDSLTVKEATEKSIATWKSKEPVFHISSPLQTWDGDNLQMHHDYIDPDDFPREWIDLQQIVTIEVEARAKEQAVLSLKEELKKDLKQIVPKYQELTIYSKEVEERRNKLILLKKNKMRRQENLEKNKGQQREEDSDNMHQEQQSSDEDDDKIKVRKRTKKVNYYESDVEENNNKSQESSISDDDNIKKSVEEKVEFVQQNNNQIEQIQQIKVNNKDKKLSQNSFSQQNSQKSLVKSNQEIDEEQKAVTQKKLKQLQKSKLNDDNQSNEEDEAFEPDEEESDYYEIKQQKGGSSRKGRRGRPPTKKKKMSNSSSEDEDDNMERDSQNQQQNTE